ncbi:MAG: aminopeptidase N [Alphaproteobacteria bacterium]|nr:aminopeptidase N [Alphaproteobacteria bacterium SS10]
MAAERLATTPAPPQPIYLKDYAPPAFIIERVDLDFKLYDDHALITNKMVLKRNPMAADQPNTLRLDGEELDLLWVKRDGELLDPEDYKLSDSALRLENVADQITLEILTRTKPQDNTRLEGLYQSSGNFCTQCEAEGFRRITYFLDRPDVLTRFTTRIEADRDTCPVLLGNGNLIEEGSADAARHYAIWDDPHPKPSYLFALVAGNLVEISDRFTTQSGRDIRLGIYVEPGNEDKTAHAMEALKNSMRWDEEAYGREYDLDVFNIVAVGDFNMGAMENKGLNIFNTKYVLASAETATDADYEGVESVIAHEYFHNWSGNRVTCRDWFQLTLKEGFTVFRDQQFSADQGDPAVKRISDVQGLRAAQFPEDAGPLAHPIQPASYIEINNFYTATVYEKGAEVIRMLHTLVGPAAFRKGTDLYFERHDGQAVTCEDFIAAIEDASETDLTQFRRWYHQAGTPEVKARGEYDEKAQRYTLTFEQSVPETPVNAPREPLQIPVRMGLVAPNGFDMPLRVDGDEEDNVHSGATERVLTLTEASQSFTFTDVPVPPVPSLFRGFSAPVRVDLPVDDAQLTLLGSSDVDPFNRWEAGQTLASRVMLRQITHGTEPTAANEGAVIDLFKANLAAPEAAHRFSAMLLTLPSEGYLAQLVEEIEPSRIHEVREHLRTALAESFESQWYSLYDRLSADATPRPHMAQIGRRKLRNIALNYLFGLPDGHGIALAKRQYQLADNMTDRLSALSLLVDSGGPEADAALADFHQTWRHDQLVVDKWFMIQGRSTHPDTLNRVRTLMDHPDFNLKNPNRLRSLIGAFAAGNPLHFHAADGSGYKLLIDVVIELNAINPQTAARLLSPMRQWRRYEPTRREMMSGELTRLLDQPDLSPDVFEVASKSLKG